MGELAGQTTSRKRILFFVPAFKGGSGGPERVIAVLLRSLDHSRYECHLALAQTGHAYLEEIPGCVVVHQLQVSRMRYALPGILRLVWRLRPQTILTTVSYLNAMVIIGQSFFPRGIKLLLREATTPSAFIEKDTHHPRLWSWLYRRLYPRAERIICLSDSVLEDMALHFGIPREKLVRIYNPVDITALRQLAAAQSNPYQGSGPHLVTAGRLRHEKGVDLLLQAMPAVIDRFPGARLSILGEGPLEAELKAQARALKVAHAVDFLGFQSNPWSYIKHADLFVLASRFEGLPNVVLESLALGTPVIAADCPGGIREICRSGAPITLVPSESPDALAKGIIAALTQETSSSAVSGKIECLKDFEVEQIAAEYSRLF